MEDWKKRLEAEYKELREKKDKLKEFLQHPTVEITQDERDMMVFQYSGMMLYQEALEVRLEYYKIKVEE